MRLHKKPQTAYAENMDMSANVNKRIAKYSATLRKLDLFWLKGSSTLAFKILVYNSVIRAKLIYGLDSAQLNEEQLGKIDTFQLKGLRKILKMRTTYGQTCAGESRTNKNTVVLEMANVAMNKDRNKKARNPKQSSPSADFPHR